MTGTKGFHLQLATIGKIFFFAYTMTHCHRLAKDKRQNEKSKFKKLGFFLKLIP